MKAEILIDWLTFSVKEVSPRDVISVFLGMDPNLFADAGYGLLGYERVLRFGDICICYDPRENAFFKGMGVCVSISGNGCRVFEAMSSFAAHDPFPSLFRLLAGHGANITRLDIACDDRSGVLDMDAICDFVRRNHVRSRMTSRSVLESWDGTGKRGATVYIGAASSSYRLRIYDKALEQGAKEHWVRVEQVLRDENAKSFVQHVVSGIPIGKLAAQVLNDKFAFIERDDSNISRCSVCSWWSGFVEELQSAHLVARPDVHHPVERINQWVSDQVAPSLSVLVQTLGWAHLFELAYAAKDRLSDRQRALIEDFNRMFDMR